MFFKLGDTVQWQAFGNGFARINTGTIIEVVPPRGTPQTRGQFGTDSRRDESYVVRVPGRRAYWPHTTQLDLVERPVSLPTGEELAK